MEQRRQWLRPAGLPAGGQSRANEDEAVIVFRTLEQDNGPLPKNWTDDEIRQRYRDSLEYVTPGESLKALREFTDWEFLELLKERVGGMLKYVRQWKQWAVWEDNHYSTTGETALVRHVVEIADELAKSPPEGMDEKEEKSYRGFCLRYKCRSGIESILALAKHEFSVSFDVFDQNPDIFSVNNGYLKLGTTVEFFAKSPKILNTQTSKVNYDPSAKCPNWLAAIDRITLGRRDLINYWQQILGWCLSGHTTDQSLYILHGHGGNGKGTLIRTMEKVFGTYAQPVRQDLLMNTGKSHVSDTSDLYAKRFVHTQEPDTNCVLSEHQVKILTGSDTINCRRLYENNWSFKPTHKLFLATNTKPIIRGTDRGIWRRVKLIPFDATFTTNLDTKFEERIFAEASGILNWLIEGYETIQMLGGIQEPAIVKASVDEYRDEMNVVKQFVDDCCERGADYRVLNDEIVQAYKLYCQQNGHYLPPNGGFHSFHRELSGMGHVSSPINGKRWKLGLRIKSEFPD